MKNLHKTYNSNIILVDRIEAVGQIVTLYNTMGNSYMYRVYMKSGQKIDIIDGDHGTTKQLEQCRNSLIDKLFTSTEENPRCKIF